MSRSSDRRHSRVRKLLDGATDANERARDKDEDDGMICCQWCGDMFPPEKMATAGLCENCVDVADEEIEP